MSAASSSSGAVSTPETTLYSNGVPVLWPQSNGSTIYIWSTILVVTIAAVGFYIWRLFRTRAQQRAAIQEHAAETREPKPTPSEAEKPHIYDVYLLPSLEDDQPPSKRWWSGMMPLSTMIREKTGKNVDFESSHTLLGNSSPPPHPASLIRMSTSSTLSTLIDLNEGRHNPVDVAFLVAMPSPPGSPRSENGHEFSAGPELTLGSLEARRSEI